MAYENMTVIDVRKRNSDGTYGTAFSISEGIVGDSMRLSQILFNSNYINLGEINSDMFEVELDISFIPEAYQNLKGYFIDVKRYNSDGASTYGHIFRGYIKDFKLDKTGQFATITAFDMYWYKKNIETSLASWWGDFWRSKVLESVQLPISLGINPSWTASQVNDYVKQYVYNLIPNDCYATIGELFDSFLDYTNTDYSMKGDTKDEIEDCTNYNARVYLKHCSLGSASGFIGSGVWSYADTYNISIRDIHYDWLQSQDSTLSYEYLLSQFCQALGLVPHFANREQQIWDGDSIKLNLFTFSTELTSKLLDDTNIDYSASSFESVYMPSFDKLIVTSSTTSGENQSELQPYEYGTGSMSYTIVDNPFLCAVSGTYNEQAIANLYDIISGFPVYLPSDITLVDSNWYDGPTGSNLNYIYDLGDKVETSRGTIVVMQTEFSGTGFINQSIRCLGDTDEITQVTSQVTSQASSSISTIGTIVNLFQYNAMKDNLISGATLKDATITGGKITDATITGSKIANSTITGTKIANSTITGSKIVDGTLDGSTKIANATISFAKMDSSFVGSLVADSAFVTELQAEIATFGYITSAEADLDYAQIDFANVANGAIKTALIQDGAITDAKIGGVSANKLTAGTIDASNITVTNLNATNITTGRITVDGITIDVTNNEASIDGGYIEDGTITMNGFSSDVVARIDGAIETFTCTDIPTLQNYPASTWTSSDYDKHVGDVAYVVNPSSSADGYTYRFTKSSNNQYSWVLIKDTDITKALQDILDLQGDVDAIESFDSTVSSFMTNTDSEITSIKSRTSSLETTMGTKVDTSTFNELSQTVDENSSSITSLSQTVSGKADSSTVSNLSNTVNTISQKTDANTSSISSLTTTVSGKADASSVYTKTETDSRISVVQQDLTGFKTTVSNTYTTKTEFNNLDIGGRNLFRNSGFLGITTLPNSDSDTTFKTDWVRGYNNPLCSFTSFADGVNQAEVTLNNSLNLGISFGRSASDMDLDSSSYYTISCWAKCTKANAKLAIGLSYYNTLNDFVWRGGTNKKAFDATDTWQKFTLTFKPDADTKGILYCFTCDNGVNGGTDKLYIRQCKLEKGNRATDWTPAPEDTDDQISALTQRVTSAESSITQNATNITTKVSKTDFTGQNMMSLINQDASSVTISASKVNLNGAVSFSSFNSSLQNQITGISNTATSAQTTANTANTTANSAYAHTRMLDTRYDDQPPSWYTAKTSGIYNEFKLCTTIGISTTATYCYLTTYVPWQGLSGGLPIQEATFSESDAVYRRYGTSASEWSAWKSTSKILAGWQYSDTTYIDGGNIYTGTITANQITVGNLSDLSDDMGTITAGVLKSHNYVADTSGMKLTLSDGVWDSKNFKISSTGAITSTAGTIGGWTIGRGLSCSYTYTPSGSTDTYVDTTTLSGEIADFRMETTRNGTKVSSLILDRAQLWYSNGNCSTEVLLGFGGNSVYGLKTKLTRGSGSKAYLEGEANFTAGLLGEFRYAYKWNSTADVKYIQIKPSSGGNKIDTNLNYVSTGDITGNDITGVNITSSSEVTTPFLTVTNTGNSAISCSGGAIFGGSILVGTKKVVVDDYASGFMAFTNDTASANTVKSSTSVRYNLASVTLTPGVYIIECVAEWRSNSTTGYRDICLSTTSQGGKIDKYCESTVAPSSAYDRQIFTYTIHITSNTTFYLTAQQNSGGDISTLGGIRALRIGNN